MYIKIEILCCIPKTNIMLYTNFNSKQPPQKKKEPNYWVCTWCLLLHTLLLQWGLKWHLNLYDGMGQRSLTWSTRGNLQEILPFPSLRILHRRYMMRQLPAVCSMNLALWIRQVSYGSEGMKADISSCFTEWSNGRENIQYISHYSATQTI